MSEIRDALNKLAGRGTPRGFDSVLSAATDDAEHASVERDAAGDDLDPIPFVTTEPIAPRRRPMRSGIAAAGIAALLVVGTFAVGAVVGSGGGSGSPEGAVRQLADALSHEDPLAAADVLAPSEVRSLHATLDAAEQKAKELQIIDTAGAPLAGVNFDVSGLTLSSETLGDGYAKVTVDTGTFSASTQRDKFSALMQKVLRNSTDNSSQTDLAKLAADQNLPTFVVTVREDGHWYVSAAYTVLEYVRESQHLPTADFGSGVHNVSTLGADSPDAALQDSVRALQSQDWSKLMTMVSPNEIPFYDYRAALNQLVAQAERKDGAPQKPAFTISSLKTTSQIDGDTAKVALKASGTTSDGTWSIDGGCFKLTPRDSASAPDVTSLEAPYALTCSPGGGILGAVLFPLSGVDQSSQFTAVQYNGRWFVSPVGTVLDVIDHFISQLDPSLVYSALNVPDRIPAEGALTLGQPVVLSAAPPLSHWTKVLTFDGHKGEQILGLAKQPAATGAKSTVITVDEIPAAVRVFGPDGTEVKDASNGLSGHPIVLPVDGTYKFVLTIQIVGPNTSDVTVTFWDAANAPADAKTDRGSSSCDYTGFFGFSCSSGFTTGSGLSGPTPTTSVGSGDCSRPNVDCVPPATAIQSPGPVGTRIGNCTVGPNRSILDPQGKRIDATGATNVAEICFATSSSSGQGQNSTATSSVPHG